MAATPGPVLSVFLPESKEDAYLVRDFRAAHIREYTLDSCLVKSSQVPMAELAQSMPIIDRIRINRSRIDALNAERHELTTQADELRKELTLRRKGLHRHATTAQSSV